MDCRYAIDADRVQLLREDGAVFDPWDWSWGGGAGGGVATDVSAEDALRWLCAEAGARRVPVGVIGPREATPTQLATAEELGSRLGQLGLTVICGGRQGVMSAVSKGVRAAGGLSVGLVPGSDWREANADIVLPIATGLGEARNMVIAKSCAALIAVGGSYGTLSEVAYGLHFSKLVLGLEGAPDVAGVRHVASVDEAIGQLAGYLLDG